MDEQEKTREIRNARLSALEAREELDRLEDKVGPVADRLLAIHALLTGMWRGRIRQGPEPDQQTLFDVYPPGKCAPEPTAFPTLKEVVALVLERQTLTDTLAEAEETLKKHGVRSPLERPERPAGRQRYTIVSPLKRDDD